MENVFLNEKITEVEKKIISSLKIPSLILMENAGLNSASYIFRNYKKETAGEVVILAGKGNNAGDGFVIARNLISKNVRVKILMLFGEWELKGDALVNFTVLKNLKSSYLRIIQCGNLNLLKRNIHPENKLIIDSVFGIGFKGIPDREIASVIKFINKLKNRTVIAIDIPSCLNSYCQGHESVKADVTLSMGVKKFHSMFYEGKNSSGKTEVINIGIPSVEFSKYNRNKIYETSVNDVREFLPLRKSDSNKYSNGKVFILSGSEGLTGAAYLCSSAAAKSGAGAVITGIPESLNDIMEVKLTEVMTLPLPETEFRSFSLQSYSRIEEKLKWADSVLIGPGLSKNEETAELVRKIVKENNLNYVIDADGISAFWNHTDLLKNRNIILTPHIGEFANLTGKSVSGIRNNFYTEAKEFAKKYKVVVLLKNAPSVITDGNYFYINPAGRENLATAGTGDVLSGIIAALLSQTGNVIMSAVSGAFIHGMCGDIIYGKSGDSSTLASDLLNEIPEVKNFIRQA